MNGVGGFILLDLVWVVAVALGIGIFAAVGDGRRRSRERQRDRTSADSGAKFNRLVLLRLAIVLVCAIASVGTLFVVAEHTVTAVEVEHPWLG